MRDGETGVSELHVSSNEAVLLIVDQRVRKTPAECVCLHFGRHDFPCNEVVAAVDSSIVGVDH